MIEHLHSYCIPFTVSATVAGKTFLVIRPAAGVAVKVKRVMAHSDGVCEWTMNATTDLVTVDTATAGVAAPMRKRAPHQNFDAKSTARLIASASAVVGVNLEEHADFKVPANESRDFPFGGEERAQPLTVVAGRQIEFVAVTDARALRGFVECVEVPLP